MPMIEPVITIRERPIGMGRYEKSVEWVGPVDSPVFVSRYMLVSYTGNPSWPMPQSVAMPGFTLRKIDDSSTFTRDGALYAREDSLWRLQSAKFWIRKMTYRLETWAVLSLRIWNLADIPDYENATWRNIRLPNWRAD